MTEIDRLAQALGVSFNDPSLLEQALVHSSYINENPDQAAVSNERLEFLGDAVLDLVIAEKLYRDFPQSSEGGMTRLRATLVRGATLARIARGINLGDYLFLGKGEEAYGGRSKPANLAGALEAVLGALFLDQGLDTASDCILRLFADEFQSAASEGAKTDHKSRLQEIIQARQQQAPTYHVVRADGPAHDKVFTVVVKVGDTTLGSGSGRSKKAAETEAARAALQNPPDDFTP